MIETIGQRGHKVVVDVVVPNLGWWMGRIKIKTFKNLKDKLPNLNSDGSDDVGIRLAYGL